MRAVIVFLIATLCVVNAANMRANKLKETYGEEFDFNELDPQIQTTLINQELISQKVFLEVHNKKLKNHLVRPAFVIVLPQHLRHF